MNRQKNPRVSMVGAAFMLLLLVGCVTERSPVTGEKESYGFSWEEEQQLGAEADEQISLQLGIYDDDDVQAYVSEVGQRVLSESDFRDADVPERYRGAEFTFRVLNTPVVNAFALPGGYVYVTRGLLAHLDNEAQLAVVLGHEIAHVAGRHSARRALRTQWSQIGLMAGVLVGSQVLGDDQTRDLLGVGGTVMQLLLNKYSRDQEREADELGVRYAAAEGYEAAEGAAFFRVLDRMAQQRGSRIPSWQSTHPDPADREEEIVAMARDLENTYQMTVVDTDEYHRTIDGLVFGDDPREGFVEGGTFYHPELRFRFAPPAQWRVQNETQAVLMADPREQAIMVLELTNASSPRAAAQELVGSEGLEVMRSAGTNINGLNAWRVEARAQSEQGPVMLMNTFIAFDGKIYSLLGYTTESAYTSYRSAFTEAIGSFRAMDRGRYTHVQPTRLEVYRTDRSGDLDSFLRRSLPANVSTRDVAIMNQLDPSATIAANTWLKIPQAR